MTTIPGVVTELDENGQLTYITIDVRLHKEVISVLIKLGLLQNEVLGNDNSVDK